MAATTIHRRFTIRSAAVDGTRWICARTLLGLFVLALAVWDTRADSVAIAHQMHAVAKPYTSEVMADSLLVAIFSVYAATLLWAGAASVLCARDPRAWRIRQRTVLFVLALGLFLLWANPDIARNAAWPHLAGWAQPLILSGLIAGAVLLSPRGLQENLRESGDDQENV